MKNWRETVRGYRPFLRRAAFVALLGLPVGCVLGGVVFEVATMRPPYDGSNVMGQALIAALFGAGFGFIRVRCMAFQRPRCSPGMGMTTFFPRWSWASCRGLGCG